MPFFAMTDPASTVRWNSCLRRKEGFVMTKPGSKVEKEHISESGVYEKVEGFFND